MELEFLGTGAGVPSKGRNMSSIALKLLDEINEIWLFDCGEATQHQILNTNIRPRKISKIFISHLHGDHIFGLPGFLSSRSYQGGDEPLTIYGPPRIDEYVKTSLRISGSKLSYKINFVILEDEGLVFENNSFSVYAQKLDHRITCFGYRVVEKDHVGELLVDKLAKYNIASGPIFGQLKAGKDVTLADGTLLHGPDFIGENKPGRIVAIVLDTRKTPGIAKLAENADVLVHEATFSQGEQRIAHAYYHSTTAQAANTAKQGNVKKLLLTHISARYTGKNVYNLQKEARKIFSNSQIARDFDIIEIPMKG